MNGLKANQQKLRYATEVDFLVRREEGKPQPNPTV